MACAERERDRDRGRGYWLVWYVTLLPRRNRSWRGGGLHIYQLGYNITEKEKKSQEIFSLNVSGIICKRPSSCLFGKLEIHGEQEFKFEIVFLGMEKKNTFYFVCAMNNGMICQKWHFYFHSVPPCPIFLKCHNDQPKNQLNHNNHNNSCKCKWIGIFLWPWFSPCGITKENSFPCISPPTLCHLSFKIFSALFLPTFLYLIRLLSVTHIGLCHPECCVGASDNGWD